MYIIFDRIYLNGEFLLSLKPAKCRKERILSWIYQIQFKITVKWCKTEWNNADTDLILYKYKSWALPQMLDGLLPLPLPLQLLSLVYGLMYDVIIKQSRFVTSHHISFLLHSIVIYLTHTIQFLFYTINSTDVRIVQTEWRPLFTQRTDPFSTGILCITLYIFQTINYNATCAWLHSYVLWTPVHCVFTYATNVQYSE